MILPDQAWSSGGRRWSLAEELGFEQAWTFDHLMWRELRGHPWFAALPTLTAAATVTSRISLGTLVAGPTLHHPASLAHELMTLDDISGGRAVVGLGAGALGHDATALGDALAAGDRAERFDEFVRVVHTLMTRTGVDFGGDHISARGVQLAPGFSRATLAVAAAGRRTTRTAARYADTWVTLGQPGFFEPVRFDNGRGRLQAQLDLLDAALAEIGRDPGSIRRTVVAGKQLSGVLESASAFVEAEEMFAELGFTDMVVFWPRSSEPFRGSLDVLEEISPRLSSAVAA